MNIVTRDVPYIIVISPQGLGDRRYKVICEHMGKRKSHFPERKRMGVNKNHLDFSDGDYPMLYGKGLIYWWERLKLAMRGGRATDFAKTYGRYFRPDRRWPAPIGLLACALSHLEAWEYVMATLSDDQAALIIEDDVLLNLENDYHTVRMPEQADVLRPHSRRVASDEPEFTRVENAHNATAYFVTGGGAEKMYQFVFPIHVGNAVDMKMFSRKSLETNAYKVYGCRYGALVEKYLGDSRSLIDGSRYMQGVRDKARSRLKKMMLKRIKSNHVR